MQLRKYRIRLGKIHHIFFSHRHGDHVFGIFGLLSSFSLLGRKEPLHLYGPEKLEEIILDHLKYFHDDLGFDLHFHRIQCRRSALIYEDKSVSVHSLPLIHRTETCGFLFREQPKERNILKEKISEYNIPVRDIMKIKQGADFIMTDGSSIPNSLLTIPPPAPRSYAYCSDTRPNKENIPLLSGVDLLYHEATFAQEDASLAHETFHSTARQAAELAVEAGIGKLLIGHFSSRYKDISSLEKEAREVFPETTAVNDGDRFEID
jgi:ribonuclease Z